MANTYSNHSNVSDSLLPDTPLPHLYSPTLNRSESPRPRQNPALASNSCPFETTFVNKARRFPMYNGDRRSLPRSEYRHLRSLNTRMEKAISSEVETLYKQLLPTPRDLQRKQDLVAKLERLLKEEWPGKDFTVHAFGSTENLLATRESDLDVCIETEWTGFEHRVCELSSFMARCGMQNVVCRAQAKVPVVAIYDPELKTACDMNINNTLALRNTRLVKTYMQLDERARQLTYAIKQWASNRALSDAVCNTLTSYTWTLMVINYLQTRRAAPVLPSLQEWPHEPMPHVQGIDVSFADDIDKYDTLQTFPMQNRESVGALLFGFFHHYAYEFNYNRDVASVRRGAIVNRREKGFPSDNMICIEEPFTVSRNLGNTADMGSHRGIHQELQRAHKLLAEGESLSIVFSKYESDKTPDCGPRPEPRSSWKPSSSPLRSKAVRTGPSQTQNQKAQLSRNHYCPPHTMLSAALPDYTESRSLCQKSNQGLESLSSDQYAIVGRSQQDLANSGPEQFSARLAPYANFYYGHSSSPPESMQRTRSQPPTSENFTNSLHSRRNSYTSGDKSVMEHSLFTNRLRTHQQRLISKQTGPKSAMYARHHYNPPLTEEHLATALGLVRIEMVAMNHESVSTGAPCLSRLSKADLEAHNANYPARRSNFSDDDASHTSLGLTHASSRSSPSSVSGYPSPSQPTYAQISSGRPESDFNPPPPLSLTSVTDESGTVSSHFPPSTKSDAQIQCTADLSQPTTVTYASKVLSNAAPSSPPNGRMQKQSQSYEPFITVRPVPQARSVKKSACKSSTCQT